MPFLLWGPGHDRARPDEKDTIPRCACAEKLANETREANSTTPAVLL